MNLEHHSQLHYNLLAEQICALTEKKNWGRERQVIPVTSEKIIKQIVNSGLYIDHRAKIKSEGIYGSLFEGLAFDPLKVRSQVISIYENESPVGVMTFIIAPKIWIEEQRYFQRVKDGIIIVDATAITKNDSPDFFIVPAWTQVLESHRNKLALPGFRTFQEILGLLEKDAPQNTWLEIEAQGQFTCEERYKLANITKKGLYQLIHEDELPFNLKMLGKNNPRSSSTVKIAQVMGLQRIENLANSTSLGPIFAKKVV